MYQKVCTCFKLIEKNYYKSIFYEEKYHQENVKSNRKRKNPEDKTKAKNLGWSLIIADALAFFIGGRVMVIIFIAALLITYAVYI